MLDIANRTGPVKNRSLITSPNSKAMLQQVMPSTGHSVNGGLIKRSRFYNKYQQLKHDVMQRMGVHTNWGEQPDLELMEILSTSKQERKTSIFMSPSRAAADE
jgi:hypothetical protein